MRAIFAIFLCSFVVSAQKVPVKEHFLSNGMKVLLVERHDAPSISGGWVARVGSANERPGITGIAHLFEHMMFKGTPTIGTKDYKRDLEIINEQERVRDLMRKEERKMRAMWRRGEIEDLQNAIYQIAKGDDIEPKEFFKVLYQIILSTTRGPKIGPFILDIGKKNVAEKISKYVK